MMLAALLALTLSQTPELRDAPIGATSTQYLDGAWTASAKGNRPAGCKYVAHHHGSTVAGLGRSRRIDGVGARECCAHCWAEALCRSSLYAAADGACLLQLDDAALVPPPTLSWTRCEPRRSSEAFGLSIPASVPGDLLTDLQRAGQIGDPLYEKTFLNSSIWNSHVWTYSVAFAPSASVLADARAGGRVQLVFDGIKMGAHISLDGTPLGTAVDQFLRYSFDVTALILAKATGLGDAATHNLEVAFDPKIRVDGRFTACTGGWDWAPYSHTYLDGAHTFSKGVWKSVYLASTAKSSVAILHAVPQITYSGAYPTARLVDGKHAGFDVAVRLHLSAAEATTGSLTLTSAWGSPATRANVAVPKGESNVTIATRATADQIKLWWPNGLGSQPLYTLSAAFTPGATSGSSAATSTAASASATAAAAPPVSVSRSVGFRYVALVTGNDTDPSYVQHAAASEGTSAHGMYFRVNGVIVFSKGANVIPMEELEGRLSAPAHRALAVAAADARFNMVRVWGGGMFLPDAFYSACDELGLLVYHDMQYAQSGHAPKATPTQDLELRHAIRRLSAHVSIGVWDGCNECRVVMGTPTGIYATFVMRVVAEEDASRAVWPSCPALGWTGGVRMLDSLPNGHTLTTPPKGHSLETHGPYLHGTGFPATNGASQLSLFTPLLPIQVSDGPTGPSLPNVFASEFGAVVMSSFESMAPTLDPAHWGLHAGQPDDTCPGGFEHHCTGPNVMAERNYPCDSLIDVYFGTQTSGYFNRTGEAIFKRQLYQCLLAQAIHVKSDIEQRRSQNELGILVWQFNEIWPTGGWGSVEYGTVGWTKGQVLGGRWKPLHYLYRRSIFADVMAACGGGGKCYVKNDRAGERFDGEVRVSALEFATGRSTLLASEAVALPAGAGVSARFGVNVSAIDAKTHMLIAECVDTSAGGADGADGADVAAEGVSAVISKNEILLAPPKELVLPDASLSVSVADATDESGAVEVVVTSSATALYVTLTTLAQGRFSDNAFAMGPGRVSVSFVPVGFVDLPTLKKSIRVEHLKPHLG